MPDQAEHPADEPGILIPSPEQDSADEPLTPKEDEPYITVSLRHWNSSSECLSEWQAHELKKLAKLINRAQSLTETSLKSDPGLGWTMHSGPAKGSGFSRPSTLSKDIKLSELRVDNKSRIHGALMDNTFYLVWLDRGHEVFPQKK